MKHAVFTGNTENNNSSKMETTYSSSSSIGRRAGERGKRKMATTEIEQLILCGNGSWRKKGD